MHRILVIEDELSIQQLLQYDLEHSGFIVDVASDGIEGYDKAIESEFDVILLDLMLPKLNGMDVCKKLREKGINSYIIMLTAMDDEFNKIKGLDTGADDYITKPFSPREVISRINAGLRRFSSKKTFQKNNIVIGDFKVDLDKYEVYQGKSKLDLTLKEYELLIFLLKNKGRVLSRDLLLNKLWDYSYDGDTRVVDVHIFKLRDKIKSDKIKIKTVRGVGYMLEGE